MTTNFLQFDSNATNILADSAYASSAQVANGLTSGIAASNLFNKVLYQTTTMCAAIGTWLSNAGNTVSDSNISGLVTALTAAAGDSTATVKDFAKSAVPSGWLACDGSAVSRTTYANLFVAIGTNWGAGNGTTTFNIPDCRGSVRVGSGTGTGLTARTLGQTGGEERHVLSIAELASHAHGIPNIGSVAAGSGATTIVAASGGLTDTTGSGTAHNTMQPFAVFTTAIKI